MKTWNSIWKPSSWVMVHLDYHTEGLRILASLEKKGESKTEFAFEEFDSIENLIKKFGTSRAYSVHVNGTGVLTRLVEFIPGYKDQLIVSGDKDDFYFCSYNDSFKVATSFFRKSLIENIIEELNTSKIFLVNISCGIIPVILIASGKEKISFDYSLEIENGRISSLTRNNIPNDKSIVNNTFKVRNEAINQGIILSQTVPIQNYTSGFDIENQAEKLDNFAQFSTFKFFGILVLTIILSSLVINHFYVNHLNNEVAQLELDLQLNNDNLTLLDRLKQEKTRKEQLVLSSGANTDQFTSFFIDKIGESVPASISLKESFVFPLKENLKEKRKVEIRQDAIEIIGFTPNSQVLDDWMERIDRYKWVKNVELLNYLKSTEGKAEFKLLITLDK
jgi:Tfp pilus assembly protein PilN